jgi:hypothetical protein
MKHLRNIIMTTLFAIAMVGGAFIGNSGANASALSNDGQNLGIERVDCADLDVLVIVGRNTTCWAGEGAVDVTLYNTEALFAHRWSGRVQYSYAHTLPFSAGNEIIFNNYLLINRIHID